MSGQPIIQAFFDEPTNTVSYLVADPATRRSNSDSAGVFMAASTETAVNLRPVLPDPA